MTPPVLYSFRRCPYAMRARMALAKAGINVRLREILLRDKPQEMLDASPKGTVPVLVPGDGEAIDESLAVMRWALGQNDPDRWLSPQVGTLDDMLALIAENDGPFKHHLDRYKYSTRYEDADEAQHRAEGEKYLRLLDARLQKTAYLFGDRIALADIAIFPFVRQFRIADMNWFDAQNWDGLKRWLTEMMDSGLFNSVMQKYPLWKEAGKEIAFP